MKRKNKGILLIVIGALLLSTAGGWYLFNVADDRHAGQKAQALLRQYDGAQSIPSNSTVADTAEQERTAAEEVNPVIAVDGEAFCGKIVIDALSVELPVYDQWSYPRLKSAPCRYAGSTLENNLIIAAHNYKSHFGSLDQLGIGDTVVFTDVYGTSHLYRVEKLVTLDGSAVEDMHAGGWDFTLFTCTKSGEQRITVRCKRI